jgi:IPT/TIG domain-containing protein
MTKQRRRYLLIALVLAVVMTLSGAQIPRVNAVGGLVLDSSGSGSCIGIQQCTTYTPSFDTVGSEDLVILQVLLNNTGTVTAVTSNQGLTWSQRAEVANGLGGKESEWFAIATQPLSNPSISITDSVAGVSIGVEIFGISGYDTANPFDPSVRTPTTASGASNSISATISTNDAYDMLLGLEYGGNGITIKAGTGFTGICLGGPGCASAAASEYELAAQSTLGSIISMNQTGGSSWGFIADAVESELPTIDSISPSQGIVGTGLTIVGTSFTTALKVMFCGTSQPFIIANDTSIVTTAPQVSSPSSRQTCDVTVTNGAGTSVASGTDQFSFLPNVRSVTPSTGGNGTELTLSGSSFLETIDVTVCGVAQPNFAIISDTVIRLNISNLELTTTSSRSCDVVVTNPNGKSSTSNKDLFNYVPQSPSGGTTRPPSAPSSSNKIFYIAIAAIATVALVAIAGLMRRWDPGKKQQPHAQSQKVSTSNPPIPASQTETQIPIFHTITNRN